MFRGSFLHQGGPTATPAVPGSPSLGLSGFIANRVGEFKAISTKSKTNYSAIRTLTILLKSLVKYSTMFMILEWLLVGSTRDGRGAIKCERPKAEKF